MLCLACHVLVNAFDSWLEDNKTDAYLEQKLEVVCTIIKSAEQTVYSSIPLNELP